MENIRDYFQLDPTVIFLNHGSFGACPRPVFEVYQRWQAELERQPVEFLGRRVDGLLATARESLANYLTAQPDEVVYFPNPTTAMNMVARSLDLQPGDEILTTNHEYGAMDRTWRFICKQTGATYIQRPVRLPLSTAGEFAEDFWQGVNSRTRAIFISHITSPTGIIFPIEEICRRARRAGILSLVDGAHAPGQIPVNLEELNVDIYTGACHKWMMAPKGAAFLYARKEVQAWLMPLVVSWGYESERPGPSQFIDYHEWQGTRDPAAFLTVPAAIEFQAQHNWETIRQECRRLAVETRRRINDLTGLEPICPETEAGSGAIHSWFQQLFAARLPETVDLEILKRRLYNEFQIEVPLIAWGGQKFIRVSIQGYNNRDDADRLLEGLGQLMD